MWIHFIALNPDKSSQDTKRVTIFAVQQFSTKRHDHYMKALSYYSIFSQEELSAVTKKEPQVPVTKEGLHLCTFQHPLWET